MGAILRRAAIQGAVVFFLVHVAASVSLAGIIGSRHDFSGSAVAPGGVCTACHTPHYAWGPGQWPRDLTEETTYFNQTSNPNYVRGDTILCYDCHDNHSTVDNDPPDSGFSLVRIPQDVAFDDDMRTTVPRDGLPDDNKLGYYEKPTSGTAISGHYVKFPPGVGEINQGDKLPCNDCHNPHDTTNQAFIRRKLANKTLVGVKGSTYMAYTEIGDGRNDADSRKFCIACHGTSEQTNDVAVTFAMINPRYGNSRIAVPPNQVSAHSAVSTTACATCHKHNGLITTCTGCHGGGIAAEGNANFWPDGLGVPPRGNVYPNRPGWHTRHVNAIATARYGAAPTTEKKNTTCDTCHPNPGSAGHEANTSGSLADAADVHRDPQNPTTHFKNIAGAVNGVQSESYDNSVAANGKSCREVDCHYRVTTPVKGTVTADGDGWFQPLAVAGCPKCHGDGTTGAALPNAHQKHVGTLSTQKAYGCWYCHPSGVANANYSFSHQTGVVEWDFANTLDPGGTRTETYAGLAVGTTAVKYGTGVFSACASVYCHLQTSPPWNDVVGATDCTVCHQTGQTAVPNPSSGLHYGSIPPTVSGTAHYDLLDVVSGCAVCHTSVRAQSTHVDGTFNGGAGAGDVARMGLFSDYTQTADNVGSCSGAAVGAAGCHAGGDAGTWARRWDASINYATNGDECKGCHGGFGLSTDTPAYGWTFGTTHNPTDGSTEHDYNWDGDANGPEVMTRHRICKTCHGMNSIADRNVNYLATRLWDPSGTAGMHGDGKIQLNGPTPSTGTGYNTATWACDNAICHGGAASLHNLEASGWPVATVDFGGAVCDSCHGYPPTGTETPRAFLDHRSRSPGASGDAAFLSAHVDCANCHGVRGNANSPPDGFVYTDLTTRGGDAYTAALHMDGSVQINGISPPDNSQNTNYQTSSGGCTRACHAATWKIAASYPTTAGKSLMEFGSGVCESCHDGTVALAPNVMTYWAGSAGGQDGGHGDPGGAPALVCIDCHDISLPTEPFSARHGTGVYNSIWDNTTRSTNTSHLKAGYFTEFPANSPGDWSIQVAFDNYCTWKCHDVNKNGVWEGSEPAGPMRHAVLHTEYVPPSDPPAEYVGMANEWSMEFGTHLTQPSATADTGVSVPIDVDLNTDAAGGKAYAPCIGCHDPHGTGVAKQSGEPSNYMMRFQWPPTANTLCSKCHI